MTLPDDLLAQLQAEVARLYGRDVTRRTNAEVEQAARERLAVLRSTPTPETRSP